MIGCIIKSIFIKKKFNTHKFNKLFKFKNKAALWMECINSQQPADNVEHLESSEFVSHY